jgi:hypothetical protein
MSISWKWPLENRNDHIGGADFSHYLWGVRRPCWQSCYAFKMQYSLYIIRLLQNALLFSIFHGKKELDRYVPQFK